MVCVNTTVHAVSVRRETLTGVTARPTIPRSPLVAVSELMIGMALILGRKELPRSMMRRLALAIAVLLSWVEIVDGFGLNARPWSAARRPHHHRETRLRVEQPTTAETVVEERTFSSSTSSTTSPLRRDSRPASKRGRANRAIKRRARRLARLRRKNKAREDASELAAEANIINDVAQVPNSTYFPARRRPAGGRVATAAAAEQERARLEEVAAPPAKDSAPENSIFFAGVDTEDADRFDPPPRRSSLSTLAEAAKRRKKKKHATIKGRPIVKGGKDRGLWRSIFGPRPLLEVHSIEQLSQLVDAEGWGLEDLSVLTGGPSRPAESAAATSTTAAFAAADVDDIAPESLAAAEGAASKVATEPGVKSGGGAAPATVKSNVDGEGNTAEDVPVVPTPPIPPQEELHPAVQALLERATAGTKPSMHGDGRRIGLAIEGGGMRGCVAAGMASCLHFLGMADSFDCVYGASAGSLIGAYFVSRQSNGTAVYHDVLPSAGARFIDMAKFPQALGFELPKVSRKGSGSASGEEELGALEAARAASFARVIGLDFLLKDVVGRVHGLDFDAFSANDKLQPLHVVASGVSSMGTVSLASRRGYFSTLDELTGCIRASMLVPGLAGPLVSVPKRRGGGASSSTTDSVAAPPQEERVATLPPTSGIDSDSRAGGEGREAAVTASSPVDGERRAEYGQESGSGVWELATAQPRAGFLGAGEGEAMDEEEEEESLRKKGEREVPVATAPAEASESSEHKKEGTSGGCDASELLVDAMVFEPLPYRSAIEDGCTDVVVLCTRPEGSQVLGKKPSIYESRVVKKFFEQHDDPYTTSGISNFLQQLEHLRVYAEDALVLGEGSRTGVAQAAPKGGAGEGREAFLLAIAPAAASKEVGQLEMDRRVILQGCRDGFAACYDAFVGPAKSLAAAAADDGADVVGPLARSGAEMAHEYFPDSLLSTPADINATYLETGHLISDNQRQGLLSPFPPLAPADENGSGTAASQASEGVGGGRGGFRRSWLGRNNGGGASSLSPLKTSPSDGRRGLLRRLLSRSKLRRKLQGSSSRSASPASAPAEAMVTGSAESGSADATAAEPAR